MKNRNKRRRNIEVAVEIFRIQNFFFFPPIFLKTRIIHGGNKSFVFSLSLKKLFKEQLFRISLYIIFRRLFLIINQEKKRIERFRDRRGKGKQRKPFFHAFFFEYRSCCSFGTRKGCVALNNREANFPVERDTLLRSSIPFVFIP